MFVPGFCARVQNHAGGLNPYPNDDRWGGHSGSRPAEREFFIDNLLVRIHLIIVMIRWTGLPPWEFESPFPGSLTSTFLNPQTLNPQLNANPQTQVEGTFGFATHKDCSDTEEILAFLNEAVNASCEGSFLVPLLFFVASCENAFIHPSFDF